MKWNIVYIFMYFHVTLSLLLYQRYDDSECVGIPYFEYANNRSSTYDFFCSDLFPFIDHMIEGASSIGFKIVNSSHLEVMLFDSLLCDKYDSENITICTIPLNTCVKDIFEDSEFGGLYCIFSFVDYIPEYLVEPPTSELPSIRIESYLDNHCQNKSVSDFHFDVDILPTNTPNAVFLPLTSYCGFLFNYKGFNHQTATKRCNKTHLTQYFTNDETGLLEELSLFRLDQKSCFQDYREYEISGSYYYECYDESFFDYNPSEYTEYIREENYWNNVCYGSAYRILEYHNGRCHCEIGSEFLYESHLCALSYVIDGFMIYILQLRENNTCSYLKETREFDVTRSYLDTNDIDKKCLKHEETQRGSQCGFSNDNEDLLCYTNVVESDDRFEDDSYIVTIGHNDSCEYLKENPLVWEELKRGLVSVDFIYTIYFHDTLCMSDKSVGVEIFGPTSLIGRCTENNDLLTQYYSNSQVCSLERPYDDQYEVNMEEELGAICFYNPSDGVFFTMTCRSLYCGAYPEYNENVCSGNGVCVLDEDNQNESICVCDDGYEGVDCEIEADDDSSDDDDDEDSAEIWEFMVTILTLFPGGLIILVFTCCCFTCICICCCSMICCLLCCILGVTTVTLEQKGKLSKYGRLKHLDILLTEQELLEDKSKAHIKINKKLFEINMDDVKTLCILGEGGSNSIVFKSEWNGKVTAFKCFKTRSLLSNQDKFDEFEREVEILSSVAHPNIIQFFGACLKPPRVGIVMEFCSKGELLEFVVRFKEKYETEYPLAEKIRQLTEVTSALQYLHNRNIIHRDLKCENVLISEDESAKLMDFGLSRCVDSMDVAKTRNIGTSIYMAPEILGGKYDEKCDVFSFAIMMYIIFSEKNNPYDCESFNVELRVANDSSFRPSLEDESLNHIFSENNKNQWLKELIQKCWDHVPRKRPSCEEIRVLLGKKNNEIKNGILEEEERKNIVSNVHSERDTTETSEDDDDDEDEVEEVKIPEENMKVLMKKLNEEILLLKKENNDLKQKIDEIN